MDLFLQHKKRKFDNVSISASVDDESTEIKLGLLASLHPQCSQDVLLEALLISDGLVDKASESLNGEVLISPRKKLLPQLATGYQSSLAYLRTGGRSTSKKNQVTKKGRTLHLYSPEDIAAHTPCSLILNFLPSNQANDLLEEILKEVPTFQKDTFQLFDKTVQSPHTSAFFVDDWDQVAVQKTEYVYNGSYVADIRPSPPEMLKASKKVCEAVNSEISNRIQFHHVTGKKLRYQSPKKWIPNTAFVNCYDGGSESVGYHSDQLTYLGPRAIIGSLSLGVSREFRVRRIVPRESISYVKNDDTRKLDELRADVEGQISIHLPHNSLLVMHAEMQEEWKHSISPAHTIEPHPLSKNKRINITYRYYREAFHPRHTPKCKCNMPTILRCVQKKQENRGRYMWMCHVNYVPGQTGCGFFQWAEFDDDGEPPWALKTGSPLQ